MGCLLRKAAARWNTRRKSLTINQLSLIGIKPKPSNITVVSLPGLTEVQANKLPHTCIALWTDVPRLNQNYTYEHLPPHQLTFEEKDKVFPESLVGCHHDCKVGVSNLPCARILAPGSAGELGAKLEDEAEDVLDDLHDGGSFFVQQTPETIKDRTWGWTARCPG